MKKIIAFLLLGVLTFSCKEKTAQKNEQLVMHKPSEMALLMNAMYAQNQSIKQQIIQGKPLQNFPEHYLKIYTATLTDASDRNPVFEAHSKEFIQNMQKVFTAPKDSAANQFNKAVNSCITCHQTSCTGPIPRIKKLLIP